MTLLEEIISTRELMAFIGVENHSTSYKPYLLSDIWDIPDKMPPKDILIIPVQGLDKAYEVSKERVSCYGRFLWVIFVKSPFLNHNAILFDAFAQTDDISYFSDEQLAFLKKSNCRTVTICDIGIYKSRSLVKMLNSALNSLASHEIVVSLATILGYNSRGYTDIETEDETKLYTKEFYLSNDVEENVINDKFHFFQINRKFKVHELMIISSLTKSIVEIKLHKMKNDANAYEKSLKPLWDLGAISAIIKSFDKSESFDFNSLDAWLNDVGFKGDIFDGQWPITYKRLCEKIQEADIKNRSHYVDELISAIGKNIETTLKYIKAI